MSDEAASVFIGKAAHISAASPGGPRYDRDQLPEERSSIANAIFLCSSCADLIDKNNGLDFSVEKLKGWKSSHESWVRQNLNRPNGTGGISILDSNPKRDGIIAEAYFPALSHFLVKFRINLHCLIPAPIPDDINEAFRPGSDMLTSAPDLVKITTSLIARIFNDFNFSNRMLNFSPSRGGVHMTNLEFLISELHRLKRAISGLLSKYAATGSPDLIQNMELILNRIDNLVGPFGLSSGLGISKSNIEMMESLFELMKQGFGICGKLRS